MAPDVPPLLDGAAGVDREGDAGDVPGLVGGEEQHGVRDVDRFYPFDGQGVQPHERLRCVIDRGSLQIRPEEPVRPVVKCHVGTDRRRVQRVARMNWGASSRASVRMSPTSHAWR